MACVVLWRSVFSDSRHVIGTGLLGRLDGECIVLAKASAASARSCCGRYHKPKIQLASRALFAFFQSML